MKTLKELSSEILGFRSILLFCHIRPDGDTLGSAVALCLALRQKGIKCDIICDGKILPKYCLNDTFLGILPVETQLERYDAHISVDIPGEHLFGRAWGIYSAGEKVYAIDHHLSNSRYTKNLWLEQLPANALLIYKLLIEMKVDFSKEIAESLLLGIITDTGNFMHNSTSAECLIVAGELLKYGANMQKIVDKVFKSQTKERSQLYLSVMSKMRFLLDSKLAIITISKQDLSKYGLEEDATEGFVDYPLTIEPVEVAVSLLEFKNELYRVSFRSRGKVNVNEVASEFGGGGHTMASGCVISGPYEEVIEKITRAVDINIY